MRADRLQSLLAQATREGVLPSDAQVDTTQQRPWPVVLLTALGAWLAIIPLLAFILLVFDLDPFRTSAGGVLGLALVTGACVLLKASATTDFLEQAAFPCLVAGLLLICFCLGGYFRLDEQRNATIMCIGVLLLAAWLPQHWLRALFGAAAACLAGFALFSMRGATGSPFRDPGSVNAGFIVLQSLLLLWTILMGSSFHVTTRRLCLRNGALLESLGAGWIVITLCWLAVYTGVSFFGAGPLSWQNELARNADIGLQYEQTLFKIVSVVFWFLGGAIVAWRWPSVRQGWCALAVLAASTLAWFMPTLGGAVLILALCVSTQRWYLAAVAALCVAWVIGAFYYSLAWPLIHKAGLFAAVSFVVACLAAWGLRVNTKGGSETSMTRTISTPSLSVFKKTLADKRWHGWGIVVSAVLIILTANIGIWQKEQLIRHGEIVFLQLVPMDPRSLMQGDYMALNFVSRSDLKLAESKQNIETLIFDHPRMVFKRDEQHIVSSVRVDGGEALSADELVIKLVPKDGRWMLVTDAFYFKEGEAARWATAKYGEFRVDKEGGAVLVGLRGEGLKPL